MWAPKMLSGVTDGWDVAILEDVADPNPPSTKAVTAAIDIAAKVYWNPRVTRLRIEDLLEARSRRDIDAILPDLIFR